MQLTNVTTIETYEAEDGWRWRAKAANGEIVATGESHGTKHDALRAARDVFPDPAIAVRPGN